jgi:Fur family transcriptional regulator, ferric uptake regulator
VTAGREAAILREPWSAVPARLRQSGLRWTPQRRLLIEILAGIDGHVTGAEVVERCRRLDPATTPSTVYRTLDVLEELGLVRHCHGADGREEYHVLPAAEHGHIYCKTCGAMEEIPEEAAPALKAALTSSHDFAVDVSHVTIVGQCRTCRAAAEGYTPGPK